MRKLLLMILFSTFSMSVFARLCEDESLLRQEVEQLRLELACNNGHSLHDCAHLMKGPSLPFDLASPDEMSCELEEQVGPSLPVIRKLAKTVSSAITRSKKNTYVNSLEDFVEHTRLHRSRVLVLGLELFHTHPELFKGLTEGQVSRVLASHDAAKLSATAVKDGKPFYRLLYENYGKEIDPKIVSALNETDGHMIKVAYLQAGLNDGNYMSAAERVRRQDLRFKLSRIERIADLVDRGEAKVSVEEFGHQMSPAHNFLKSHEDKLLAKELENKYEDITRKYRYKSPTFLEKIRIANSLKIEEETVRLLKNEPAIKLSSKAMAYSVLRNSKEGLGRVLGFFGTKVGARILMAADFVTLYFAEMNQIGCDGIGHNDWVKDPNCSPAVGLTPKIVGLLSEDFDSIKYYAQNEFYTCGVLAATYKESIAVPKVSYCGANEATLELLGHPDVRVKFNNKHEVQAIDLGGLGSEATSLFNGIPQSLKIDEQGDISEVCYTTGGRFMIRHCYAANEKNRFVQKGLGEVKDLVRSVNFQVQKALNSCHP